MNVQHNDMVERVAKAIAFSGLTGPSSNWPEYWARLEDYERTSYLTTARAAVEAMREPTDQMWAAAGKAADTGETEWSAMIDAALHQAGVHF